MTILPNRPVTVNVRRSGGLLGRAVEMNGVLPAGSPAHAAALAMVAEGAPPATPSRSRDGFAYRVEIADDEGAQLLHAVFRDPLPDQLAALMSALAATGPQ